MPILRLSRKRYKVVNKVKKRRRIRIGDHTPKPVRLTKTVAMDIRLYVATMTNIVNTLASIYRGENTVYKFMEKMLEEVKYCKTVIKKHFNKPLVMTEVDEQNFKTMDGCHICGEKYTDKDVRVRDHCHITGKFRGSAHQECNLKLRIKPENLKILVIFHNLRGYDSHFIMQQIGEIANKHGYTNKKGEKQNLNINAIPNNMENIRPLCWVITSPSSIVSNL